MPSAIRVSIEAAVSPVADSALAELRALNQWIAWWSVPGERKPTRLPGGGFTRVLDARKKPHKLPVNPRTGNLASSTNPASWGTYDEAIAAVEHFGLTGPGFVFTNDDPYCGIDLDDCRDRETGAIAEWAQEIIDRLGSYTEVSPSGTGVKLWVRADLGDGKGHRTKYAGGEVEMYSQGRYFTFTGQHLPGTPATIEDRQSELDAVYDSVFGRGSQPQMPSPAPEGRAAIPKPAVIVGEPRMALTANLSDADIIHMAGNAKNGAKFLRLFGGDTTDYRSHSEADAALCAMLAFYVGDDPNRIDRLFRQSRLYREKWERADYRTNTISGAMRVTTSHFGEGFRLDETRVGLLTAGGGGSDAAAIAGDSGLAETIESGLKSDPGAVFDPLIIGRLAILRDPAERVRVEAVLRKNRIPKKSVKAAVENHRRLLAEDNERGTAPTNVIEGSPAPDLLIPRPYYIDETGTWEWSATRDNLEADRRLVAHAPVIMSGILRDLHTRTESLKVHWKRGGHWHERVIDRGVAFNSKKVVDLAAEGFPVSSDTAGPMAKYLAALEAANVEELPVQSVTSRLGWQGTDGDAGFLCGTTLVSPDGSRIDVNGADGESAVHFRAAAAGEEQLVRGYTASGSFEEWQSGIRLVEPYPRARVALYAAFVPPILMVLSAPNFIMDWAYRTSAGKTTVLRIAASVWGNPHEQSPDTIIRSWDATQVAIERTAALTSGLPVFLDDTKRVKDSKHVSTMLYEMAHGQGRARGNIRGIASTTTWRTVLLSTGEAPAISFTQDGGTRTRCIQIKGAPFGEITASSAAVVDAVNAAVRANYGHAGPVFVEWLTKNRDRWPQLRRDYQAAISRYVERKPEGADSAVADRLAHYAAAIYVAGKYAHAAMALPFSFTDPLEELWPGLVAAASDAPGEVRALQYVMSWAHGHSGSFWGRSSLNSLREPIMPSGGWSGRWPQEMAWKYIGFFPHVLDKLLTDAGYHAEAIISGWRERGWLRVRSDGKGPTLQMRVGEDRARLIVLRREAIDRAVGGDSGDKVETQVETG